MFSIHKEYVKVSISSNVTFSNINSLAQVDFLVVVVVDVVVVVAVAADEMLCFALWLGCTQADRQAGRQAGRQTDRLSIYACFSLARRSPSYLLLLYLLCFVPTAAAAAAAAAAACRSNGCSAE